MRPQPSSICYTFICCSATGNNALRLIPPPVASRADIYGGLDVKGTFQLNVDMCRSFVCLSFWLSRRKIS